MARQKVWKAPKEPAPRNDVGALYPLNERTCAQIVQRIETMMVTDAVPVSDRDMMDMFVHPHMQAQACEAALKFQHNVADGNQIVRIVDNNDPDYGVVQYRFRNSGPVRFLLPTFYLLPIEHIRETYREQLTHWVNHVTDLHAVLYVISTLNETCHTFGELYALFPYVEAFDVTGVTYAKNVMKVPAKPPRLNPKMKDAWRRAVRAITRAKLTGITEKPNVDGWHVTFVKDMDRPDWARCCHGIYI